MKDNSISSIENVLAVVKKLRDPIEGCPWDIEQTHKSLSPYFKEEVCEFLEDLENEGPQSPKTHEELGDVFYQVLIHAQLFEEKGYTNFFQIAENLRKKLISRHPHVFDPNAPRYKNSKEVSLAWEKLKAQTKPQTASSGSWPASESLRKIPKSLGPLQVSSRMGEKMSSFGFDWVNADDVKGKISEEIEELTLARGKDEQLEEAGDLLFAVTQYCRKLGIDAENALEKANKKFQARVLAMEQAFSQDHVSWDQMNLETMEKYWSKAKADLDTGASNE